MRNSFAVLGAGTWGAVIAAHLHNAGHGVKIWHFLDDEAREFQQTRRHPFLDNFTIPEGIEITSDLAAVIESSETIVVVVPSQVVRDVMKQAAEYIDQRTIANLSKGIEQRTLLRMSEVIMEAGGVPEDRVATVSGPSHAEEVMVSIPTTLVAASHNLSLARQLQQQISSERLRVYATQDIVGVELGGSVKNVIAIAAGICEGIGFGDNSMAALITRGLAEITRLGLAMGADSQTFAGLSGIGDLVVTASSRHSRNRRLGVGVGQGRKMQDVLDEMGMVAEGIYTARSVLGLAEKYQVEMPICREVHAVLFEDKDPLQAITHLMTRDLRDESIT